MATITPVDYGSNNGTAALALNPTVGIGVGTASGGVVTLSHSADPGAYTAPSGWTQVGSTVVANSGIGGFCWLSMWLRGFWPGATSYSWSWVNATNVVGATGRYNTTGGSLAVDQTTSSTGTNTTPTSGSITTTSADELLVLGVAVAVSPAVSGITLSAPTNSFTLEAQDSSITGLGGGLTDRIVGSTSTYSTAVTADAASNWATILTGFKVVAVAADQAVAAWGTPQDQPFMREPTRVVLY